MSRAAERVMPFVAATALIISALVIVPAARGNQRSSAVAASAPAVVSFGQPASISGSVTGDVQVVGSTATIAGHVTGDVVVLAGNVVFMDGAVVDGDVVCIGGHVRGADKARIKGQVFDPGSFNSGWNIEPIRESTSGSGSPTSLLTVAVKLSLMLAWLAAAVLITLFAGREVRASSVELRVSAVHSLVLGLVAFTSFVLTAIVFSYLVPFMIGVPLLAALGVFAVVVKIFGMVAVFHAIGSAIAGARNRDQLSRRRWLRGDLAMTVIGLVILGAIHMLPVVGNAVWMLSSVFGIGVAVGTRFGTREPWFLAELNEA